MPSGSGYWDQLLFAVLPYIALAIFFLYTIKRYREQSFTYSSLSSQFLENEQHFWALVPFHYAIIFVLGGHVVAFLTPRSILLWNAHPLRLYLLEISALMGGLMTVVGLLTIVARRTTNRKVRRVSSVADWVVYALLLLQAVTGVYVALFHPWGSSWFATSAAPYLWSIAKLNPQVGYVATMPLAARLHIVNAFVVIGFFPFTRLVHILVIPNMYLWRKAQVVRWWRPAGARRVG